MKNFSIAYKVFHDIRYFLAFGFGSGLLPKAPGTWGTVASIPLYLLMAHMPLISYCLLVIALCGLGIMICDKVSDDMGVHDAPQIVWDEIVGFLITMYGVPLHFVWILAGFVLFRLFDVLKFWPISLLDKRVTGGLGIMLDDVVAGICACFCLHGLVRIVG